MRTNFCTKLTLKGIAILGLFSEAFAGKARTIQANKPVNYLPRGVVSTLDSEGVSFALTNPTLITDNGHYAIDPCTGDSLSLRPSSGNSLDLQGKLFKRRDPNRKQSNKGIQKNHSWILPAETEISTQCSQTMRLVITKNVELKFNRDIRFSDLIVTADGLMYDRTDGLLLHQFNADEFKIKDLKPKLEL